MSVSESRYTCRKGMKNTECEFEILKKVSGNSRIVMEIVERNRILVRFYSNSILFWNRIGVEIVELLIVIGPMVSLLRIL